MGKDPVTAQNSYYVYNGSYLNICRIKLLLHDLFEDLQGLFTCFLQCHRLQTHKCTYLLFCVKQLPCLENVFLATIMEFGVLCCLTTPGLRKDIRRQIRQLYLHKVTYYVHYNYILSSHLLSHSRFYIYY